MSGGPSWSDRAVSAARGAYAGVYDTLFPPPSVEAVYAEQAARIRTRFPVPPPTGLPTYNTKRVRVDAYLLHPVETVPCLITVPLHEVGPRGAGLYVFEFDVQRETRLELLKRHKFPSFESQVALKTETGFLPFAPNDKIKCSSAFLTLDFVEIEPAKAGGTRKPRKRKPRKRSKLSRRSKRYKRPKRPAA